MVKSDQGNLVASVDGNLNGMDYHHRVTNFFGTNSRPAWIRTHNVPCRRTVSPSATTFTTGSYGSRFQSDRDLSSSTDPSGLEQ